LLDDPSSLLAALRGGLPKPPLAPSGAAKAAEECPDNNAVLGSFFAGIKDLGQAAVPINLILLGNALSKGPNWQALPVRVGVGIVIAKMVLMPLFAVGMMLFVDHTLGDDSQTHVLPLRDPYDEVFFVAACAVAATPTANNMMVMTELAGGNGAAMGTAIFMQYMVAPVVLTLTLTFTIIMLHAYG